MNNTTTTNGSSCQQRRPSRHHHPTLAAGVMPLILFLVIVFPSHQCQECCTFTADAFAVRRVWSRIVGRAAGAGRRRRHGGGDVVVAEPPNLTKSTPPSSAIIHENLLGRRTMNTFEPTLPDGWEDSLQKAVHAATYAPNHKRTEPWRFHLLGPESIEKVCQLNAKLVAAKKGPKAGDQKMKRWLAMPGWLVVTCQGETTNNMNMLEPMSLAREDYAACCCAVQNLCLSLAANGLGTKWTTGPVNFDPDFADAVGFSSQEEFVVGTIWFGTPDYSNAPPPTAPPKKLTVEDVLIRHD